MSRRKPRQNAGRAGILFTLSRRRPAARRRRLHAERLEDRLLMYAADFVGPLPEAAFAAETELVSPVGVSEEFIAPNSATSEDEIPLPGQFQSIDELEAWLLEAAIAEWGHLFGNSTTYPSWGWHDWPLLTNGIGGAVFRIADSDATSTVLSVDHSTTNVQVEGVDEADLIETDGEYLYIISGLDLVIVEAGVGEDLRVASRVRLDQRPVGMFLMGDRLAMVSSSQPQSDPWGSFPIGVRLAVGDYQPYGEEPTTTVTILDITDRAAPMLVQRSEMDGRLVSSRAVDGELRLVVSNEFRLPMPIARRVDIEGNVVANEELMPPQNLVLRGDVFTLDDYYYPVPRTQYVYETQQEYVARVRDELLDSLNPRLRNLALDGSVIDESSLVEPTDLYRPDSLLDRQVTTIATFDMTSNGPGPASKASIVTQAGAQIYSTAESMYVFANRMPHFQGFGRLTLWTTNDRNESNIWKFDFDAESHDVDLAAKGAVKGQLLNQFAADEHEGFLRVVTTNNGWTATGQSVSVLQQVGPRLNVVGIVEGIAPTEQLYSVRFRGDRAFFVTFRVVDPLFAVDLSDPANPQLLGELHIPGFSDYLQPLDENHLLAIGRGANETTGMFEELQVSIFDVSDLAAPELLHRYAFEGGRAIATPATGDRWQRGDGDHHAVSYFPAEQIFALPIYHADGWWSEMEAAPPFEAGEGGLQVFKIDVTTGFTPLAIIEHDTLVERSVRIGSHLYAISSSAVTVHEITDPAVTLGELSIGTAMAVAPTDLRMFQSFELQPTFEEQMMGPLRPAEFDEEASLPPTNWSGFIGPLRYGAESADAVDHALAAITDEGNRQFAELLSSNGSAENTESLIDELFEHGWIPENIGPLPIGAF